MRTFLKIIGALVVLGAAGLAAVLFMTSGEREVARNFVLKSTGGDYAAAQGLLHPSLQREFDAAKMRESFGGVAPYVEVSFTSIEASSGVTRLEGTARTASGCTSRVSFEVVGDRITAFDISPLCPRE